MSTVLELLVWEEYSPCLVFRTEGEELLQELLLLWLAQSVQDLRGVILRTQLRPRPHTRGWLEALLCSLIASQARHLVQHLTSEGKTWQEWILSCLAPGLSPADLLAPCLPPADSLALAKLEPVHLALIK